MKYLTYDPTTGEILTYGESDSLAQHDAPTIYNSDATTWTHHIVDGVPVAYTDAQRAAKAAMPDYPTLWSNATMGWQDLRDIATVREDVLATLEAAYVDAIAHDISFTTSAGDTRAYQADADSVGKARDCILGCMGPSGLPDGFYWVAKDNTRVPFAWGDLQGLAGAMFQQGHAAFEKLQDLKVAARAAATVGELKSVVWGT